MTILNIKELYLTLPKLGRLLGLDIGKKTIGLSMSDKLRTIATPLITLKRKTLLKDLNSLNDIIEQHNIVALVIGFPINMNGTEGPKCQSVKQFIADFSKYNKTPTILWDERLSTIAVTRVLIKADVSRSKQNKAVDKMASSFVLQGLLDALKNQEKKAEQ